MTKKELKKRRLRSVRARFLKDIREAKKILKEYENRGKKNENEKKI